MQNREIPGYYFDTLKNRYFRLKPGQIPSTPTNVQELSRLSLEPASLSENTRDSLSSFLKDRKYGNFIAQQNLPIYLACQDDRRLSINLPSEWLQGDNEILWISSLFKGSQEIFIITKDYVATLDSIEDLKLGRFLHIRHRFQQSTCSLVKVLQSPNISSFPEGTQENNQIPLMIGLCASFSSTEKHLSLVYFTLDFQGNLNFSIPMVANIRKSVFAADFCSLLTALPSQEITFLLVFSSGDSIVLGKIYPTKLTNCVKLTDEFSYNRKKDHYTTVYISLDTSFVLFGTSNGNVYALQFVHKTGKFLKNSLKVLLAGKRYLNGAPISSIKETDLFWLVSTGTDSVLSILKEDNSQMFQYIRPQCPRRFFPCFPQTKIIFNDILSNEACLNFGDQEGTPFLSIFCKHQNTIYCYAFNSPTPVHSFRYSNTLLTAVALRDDSTRRTKVVILTKKESS